MNKRANILGDYAYIVTFFLLLFGFVFYVGMYDFMLEEVYKPTHTILNESLITSGVNQSSLAYTYFEDNYTESTTRSLPFNLLLIFFFVYSIIASLVSASKSRKLPAESLVLKTIGGMLFLMFILQFVVFEFLTYVNENFINLIFVDLIINYLPFHSILMNNAYIIALVWGLSILMVNRFLGEDN